MPRSDLIVSLTEWEYAWRYWEHILLGDPEPDSRGFDPIRTREIERIVRDYHREYFAIFFGSRHKESKSPANGVESDAT